MCSSLIGNLGAIAGRMACVLAAALLTCAFSAHAQVIEEGGFPVKGGGVSGETFSLSCPSRLVVQAGSSIVLSCSATAVPEEGIRYEWESISVGGLDFLSAPDELSPLFMAPSSGAGEKYAYRLTATAPGVYETADVTVSVEGFSGDSAHDRGEGSAGPGDCSSFAFEGYREGCSSKDEGSQPFSPFGGFPGEEGGLGFPFPGSPGAPEEGLPGLLQAGDPAQQTAPYLDCPPAVFLQELEVGSIECHVSDAVGEEFLEYMWEPVGSTTRDYLDNPRLIPEDAPNPSVVAPEAPVYETLEAFRSGETTFRYRYRLTATSRATGLSSSSEVEVFVSSSRPSVYCPLEVVVEEGATIALDCEGVDPLSGRMDYDEDGASIEWEWSGLWGTSTTLLDGTDLSSPLFTAPAGSAGKEYHYIASMTSSASGESRTARRRVTVTVTGGEEGEQDASDASAPLGLNCPDHSLYAGAPDIQIGCTGLGSEDIDWTWSSPHSGHLNDVDYLDKTYARFATFYVPTSLPENVKSRKFKYAIVAEYGDSRRLSKAIDVLVLNMANFGCTFKYDVDEGDDDIMLNCWFVDGPMDAVYTYAWAPRSDTPNTDLLIAGTDGLTPTFSVPDKVDEDKMYRYTMIASAEGFHPATGVVTVKVTNKPSITVTCEDPDPVYEGADDFALGCSVTRVPDGVDPTYVWTARGGTTDTDELSSTTIQEPTFAVPDEVDENETYKYTLTVRASGESDSADVTVTVKKKPQITVTCEGNPYEGDMDEGEIWLRCSAKGAPGGSAYRYRWTTRNGTPNKALDKLSDTKVHTPRFQLGASPYPTGTPNAEHFYYRLTASAENARPGAFDVTATQYLRRATTQGTQCNAKGHSGTVHGGLTVRVDEGDDNFLIKCHTNIFYYNTGVPPVSLSWTWSTSFGIQDTWRLNPRKQASTTFRVPRDVDRNTEYNYEVAIRALRFVDTYMRVKVTVLDTGPLPPALSCENPDPVYEGAGTIRLDCSVKRRPSGAAYAWTARAGTSGTSLLSSTTILKPTFAVPDNIDVDTDYKYRLTLSAPGIDDITEDVTVAVLEAPDIEGTTDLGVTRVWEGDPDFMAPGGSYTGALAGFSYKYLWTARNATATADLRLSDPNIRRPYFLVPAEVSQEKTYEYTLTVSAKNADPLDVSYAVIVQNKPPITVTCTGNPYEVNEGENTITLDCSASGAPPGSTYDYAWTARGSTADTALLTAGTDGPTPTFATPPNVNADTDYEYLLTVTAEHAESAEAEVTVTVLNKAVLSVSCAPVSPVYEGSDDFDLECVASGAPAGSDYAYAWTARGDTEDTALLTTGTDGPTPTFATPDEVDNNETYEYLLTVTAEHADPATAEVAVTVLNKGVLNIACASPPLAYEGSEDFALDCSASGALGDNPAYTWTARGSTEDTALLSAANISSPFFMVPGEIDKDETYEYLLTVTAENAESASAEVAVTVLNKKALNVACASPPVVYEGAADLTFDCSASGAPAGSTYNYAWTARGSTADTALLTGGTDGPTPTFAVPDEVDVTTTYEYLLTASAENAEDGSAEVTVTVLNTGALAVVCTNPASVYEGSADFALDCSASGAPAGSAYDYAWTARDGTANTDLLIAGTDGPTPTFAVPEDVDATTTYEYLLTASAENAADGAAEVTVTVLNTGALAVVCTNPASVYEGSADFALDCSASGAPAGSAYDYAWTARDGTANTDLLIAGTDGPTPTFAVPEDVASTTTYEYLLTVSAENAADGAAEVTVTVLNTGALAVVCTDPDSVYEGSADITLDCSASGAPAGSDYAYVWTARGDTQDTSLLSAVDIASPTFLVPDEVASTTTYEYLLTVSATNAESASAEVTVTVLNRGVLAVACTDPDSVYEGSEDFALDCSASGAPAGSEYAYAWTARGSTANTALLVAGTDGPTPTFAAPDALDATTTYEYLLTVSATNAESASAEVTVTVLNRGVLAVVCTDPDSVYEGSEDFALDCSASGAPAGSEYAYAWTARGSTANTALLIAGTDGPTPTFAAPDALDATTTYEYLLTVSATNAESASAEVTVTVLNRGVLAVVCTDPDSVYEGSEDFALDCSASGAPAGSEYAYVWTARGSTANTALLVADTDGPTPTFAVPDALDATTTYEYLLTVSATNAESASAEVTVTVLNRGVLAVVCTDPDSVYEGSEDFALDCSASGVPAGSEYAYAWTARGSTANTDLLIADTDGPTPTFAVPDVLDATTAYEYLLTVSAENAEDGAAEVTVTVLNRPPGPATDSSPPIAESPLSGPSPREVSEALSLGVTASASPLRFGVQSADTEASLDPMTDQLSTHISGPYHAGRMTLSLDGSAEVDENGNMALSIELASPVVLRSEGGIEDASIVLLPRWSFAESCEQLSSQAIGGLYTETTLSEADCRLLYFGGELDLTDAPSGHYAGSMDVVLRSGENEETHSVEVDVTVLPAQRVITIGPGGVRFSTSRELPAGLTEEQNLSIYPDVAFLTEGKPHGVFELSNPSLVPLEVTVSARFGYTEATEAGREVVVEDPSDSPLGDLSQVVDIHPGVLVLQPGEKGLVRYGVQEGALAAMAEKGYAAFFDLVSEPRQYVRSDRMPEEVSGGRTARVTMRVPGVYVPDEGVSQLRATLLSISYVGSMSATFLVETQDRPFVGEVAAYDDEGHELGRRETLVYTRSRVRVPLDRMPEGGAVFLRFAPRGGLQAPEAVSVPWDAPRRDIGDAEDKVKKPTNASIAGKP